MKTVSFTVYGKPQGKARPRFTKSGRVYTPKTTAEYEQAVTKAYIAAANGYRFEDKGVKVIISAYFVPAKSSRRTKPTIKPDIDNIIKAILDGLNGVAYNDDKQVVCVLATKSFSPFIPYVAVEISDVE